MPTSHALFVSADLFLSIAEFLFGLEETSLLAFQDIHLAIQLLFSLGEAGFLLAKGALVPLQLLLEKLSLSAPLVLRFQCCCPLE